MFIFQIINFDPKYGPLGGATSIVITGENLGKSKEEIEIFVAGKRCHVIDYQRPNKVTCKNAPSDNNIESGPVVLKVAGKYQTKSKTIFTYVVSGVVSFLFIVCRKLVA